MLTRLGEDGSLAGDGDDRGQSEVIGVVLMVAILVVIAAVIGQYVFGLDIVRGKEQAVGPQVTLTASENGGKLTIEHESGDSLITDHLTVANTTGEYSIDWDAQSVKDEWTAGEKITIDPEKGETIRIIWKSPRTKDSKIIFEHTFSG